MLFPTNVIFLYETGPMQLICSQHCGCWWRGALATVATVLSTHKETVYRQVSNIRRTLEGNKIVDHSDVVGASPIGAAPTTSSFST